MTSDENYYLGLSVHEKSTGDLIFECIGWATVAGAILSARGELAASGRDIETELEVKQFQYMKPLDTDMPLLQAEGLLLG